jgi:hypothetical protein
MTDTAASSMISSHNNRPSHGGIADTGTAPTKCTGRIDRGVSPQPAGLRTPGIGAIAIFLFCQLAIPLDVSATQTHGGAEGLIAHQLAHLFFMLSMGILVYWLRQRRLVIRTGWRLIQFAAVFMMLWNIDAFLVHFLEEQPGLITVHRPSPWQIRIDARAGNEMLAVIYYLAKLDHLLCVPAMLMLYLGLQRLLAESSGAKDIRP